MIDCMTENLLLPTWTNLDSQELRILLHERFGHGQMRNARTLVMPLGGESCRIEVVFRDEAIESVSPGPAFDALEWQQISEQIERSILVGTAKIGREYSFSSFRVSGSWRGSGSGLQILPPAEDAPRATMEMADHPFILEFPVMGSDLWPVMNHRRLREHRRLTLLLNVLLAGRTSAQPRRSEHFWAAVPSSTNGHEIMWVQQFFFAKLGEVVRDELSPPAAEQLGVVDPVEYYERVGHDGLGLRVPADFDESVVLYTELSSADRAKFDRATFWMDMAWRQWTVSVSASFAALISAIESLGERGEAHRTICMVCGGECQHETPGATKRFKDFLETYAPGTTLRGRRDTMYKLRSGILHGSKLLQLDRDVAFGPDPIWWNEYELQRELWGVTRVALRNWLKQGR